ncbi:MAG: hypothetical protein ACLTBV_29995 [Enterocloster bolteae]
MRTAPGNPRADEGVLFGTYQPEKGIIKVRGRREDTKGLRTPMPFEVGMVHQHSLVPCNFTVLQNIVLGMG